MANQDEHIKEYYSANVISIDQNQSIEKALDIMINHKVKRLIVTDNRKVVGIVSLSDLINYIDDEKMGSTYKKIWQIYRNTDKYLSKIDEFEL